MAVGLVAIGAFAFGGVAVSGMPVGIISLGGLAAGLLLAIGGVAFGGFAAGGAGVRRGGDRRACEAAAGPVGRRDAMGVVRGLGTGHRRIDCVRGGVRDLMAGHGRPRRRDVTARDVPLAGHLPTAQNLTRWALWTGRVEGRRVTGRVRWLIRRFRAGPQSETRRHVSSPRSPNPAGRFPAPGSPVESCGSHTGLPGAASGRVSRAVAPSSHPCAGRPVRRQTCSRPDDGDRTGRPLRLCM